MAKILTDKQHYIDIAQAIRDNSRGELTDTKMAPGAMADKVKAVSDVNYESGHNTGYAEGRLEGYNEGLDKGHKSGYSTGLSEGYTNGHVDGYNEGYEAGKLYGQTEDGFYDVFWDEYQNEGATMSGHQLFAGRGWTSNNFHPKYKNVKYTNGHMCFRYNLAVTDMSDWTIDLSTAVNCSYLFHMCYNVTHIGKIIMPTDPDSDGTNYLFTSCKWLKTIDNLVWNENITTSKYPFKGCLSLVNITFAGTINLSLDFSECRRLSKNSVANIIDALSSNATGKTITFSQTAITNEFGGTTSEEWVTLSGTKTNWNFSLV